MTGFGLGEFARITLLGAGLGVCPLALFIATHHLIRWIRGETYNSPVLFCARLGTFLVVFPITVLLFQITRVDPYNWQTIMYGIGLFMVGFAYFMLARRWGNPRRLRAEEKGDHG